MYPKAQVTRDIVHDEIDKDLLGTKSVKWSSSVALPYNVRGTLGEDMQKLQHS